MNDVKLYKESNNQVRYLTDKEARRLLPACNKDFRIVALAAMLTGPRRNELRSLRWSNVDFENGSITVESALQQKW
jgi:integrase